VLPNPQTWRCRPDNRCRTKPALTDLGEADPEHIRNTEGRARLMPDSGQRPGRPRQGRTEGGRRRRRTRRLCLRGTAGATGSGASVRENSTPSSESAPLSRGGGIWLKCEGGAERGPRKSAPGPGSAGTPPIAAAPSAACRRSAAAAASAAGREGGRGALPAIQVQQFRRARPKADGQDLLISTST